MGDLLTFILGDILHLHLPHLGHVAQHSEDDEPRHEAGQTVDQAGHNGVTGARNTNGPFV